MSPIPRPTTPTRHLVERWPAELTNRKLRRSAHRSVTELEADIRKWVNEWNEDPRPFVWTKSADEILETLAGGCQRIALAEVIGGHEPFSQIIVGHQLVHRSFATAQ